jgi:hypothetical protein
MTAIEHLQETLSGCLAAVEAHMRDCWASTGLGPPLFQSRSH